MFLVNVGAGIWAVLMIGVVGAFIRDRIDSRRAAERASFEKSCRVYRSEPVEDSKPHESKHYTDSKPYDITKAIQ